MKKIGVLTFHDVPNFGAILQAWSLVQLLRDLGGNVELINYKPASLISKFHRGGLRRFLPSYGAFRRRSFVKRHLPVGQKCSDRKMVREYVQRSDFDILVCGSDQIWMMDDSIGFDPIFFLDFPEGLRIRKVSFAPSCGSMQSFGRNASQVRQLLSCFDAISVRDRHTATVLTNLGVENSVEVVDPTLIADFTPFISSTTSLKERYLAIVGPSNNSMEHAAKQIASRLNLRILALGTKAKCADIGKRFVNPGEWANYIANAEFVVTSLFHGVMLSIKFHRNFIAIPASGREQKISDALLRFGLSERLQKVDMPFEFDSDNIRLEYSSAREQIESSVALSIKFLAEAICD